MAAFLVKNDDPKKTRVVASKRNRSGGKNIFKATGVYGRLA